MAYYGYGRISKTQIFFVMLFGTLGSIYVWKPAFEKYYMEQKELQKAKETQVESQA